jgi:hypothetical protein
LNNPSFLRCFSLALLVETSESVTYKNSSIVNRPSLMTRNKMMLFSLILLVATISLFAVVESAPFKCPGKGKDPKKIEGESVTANRLFFLFHY